MSQKPQLRIVPKAPSDSPTPDGTNWVYRDTETQKDTEDTDLCVVKPGIQREVQAKASRDSFLDFISYACEESRRLAEKRKAEHGWQSSTFHFVRLCRSRTEFEGTNPDDFFNAVPWHAADFDEDEVLTAVVEWGKVKTGAGENTLLSAVHLAQEKPVFKGERFRHFKNFALFLNIAYHLQQLQGDDDIYLPVHGLAAHLSVTARVVSHYRFMAKMYGFLKETAKHTKKRSTRFRVQLDKFPMEDESK